MIGRRSRPSPASVVIRFPNWIGDIVMALPALDIVRSLWPEARLGVQVHPRGRSLLEGQKTVDRLHPAPSRGGAGFSEAIASLREGNYDLGILLAPSFSSAWLFYLAGIPRRAGWTGEARRLLLSDPVRKPDRRTHLVAQYQAIFRIFGETGPARPLRYEPPAAALAAAEAWLSSRGLGGLELAAVAPAAHYGPAKRWPAERFGEIARRLAARADRRVVVIGSRPEQDLLRHVAGDIEGARVLAGDLDLAAVAALLKRCRLYVGNDTGLLHLARAVGTPVVGIYGSTSPAWTGPDTSEGEVVYRKLSCSPCFRRECPLREGTLACLEQIGIDQVEQAIERVLALAPAAAPPGRN